jgi:hypothetical protein
MTTPIMTEGRSRWIRGRIPPPGTDPGSSRGGEGGEEGEETARRGALACPRGSAQPEYVPGPRDEHADGCRPCGDHRGAHRDIHRDERFVRIAEHVERVERLELRLVVGQSRRHVGNVGGGEQRWKLRLVSARDGHRRSHPRRGRAQGARRDRGRRCARPRTAAEQAPTRRGRLRDGGPVDRRAVRAGAPSAAYAAARPPDADESARTGATAGAPHDS